MSRSSSLKAESLAASQTLHSVPAERAVALANNVSTEANFRTTLFLVVELLLFANVSTKLIELGVTQFVSINQVVLWGECECEFL